MSRQDWDRPQYDNGIAFLDLLFNQLLSFALLFLLALLLVKPPTTSDASVKLRAEFVMTMTWPDGALDDIDMWVQLPDGRKVNFRNKDVDYVTLDRDDLGALNDFYTVDGRRELTMMNREMATIRAIVPGRYIVAAHVYAVRDKVEDPADRARVWLPAPPLPYAATLEVMKLNPRSTEVLRSTVQVAERGQEAVFAAFDVDADGNVTNVELNPSQYQIVDLVPTFGGAEDPLR
jgi:hypothetical protein